MGITALIQVKSLSPLVSLPLLVILVLSLTLVPTPRKIIAETSIVQPQTSFMRILRDQLLVLLHPPLSLVQCSDQVFLLLKQVVLPRSKMIVVLLPQISSLTLQCNLLVLLLLTEHLLQLMPALIVIRIHR